MGFHSSCLIFVILIFAQAQPLARMNVQPSCEIPGCFRGTPNVKNVHYHFIVDYLYLPNTTKPSIAVNGMIPGPTIDVNEFDTVIVEVLNLLDEAISIHWHGLYQVGTSQFDGVPGVSQCLQQTNTSFTYRFRAEPAGTTWWHSHYNNQYINGLFGPLIIRRQGGEVYQEQYSEEWIWAVSDWYDYPAAQIREQYYLTPTSEGDEPIPDAIMINGKFTNELIEGPIDPNTTVLVRVINAAGFSMFNVSIDSLVLAIVAIDGVDISPPLVVPWFMINVAQRIDFLVQFSQHPDVDARGSVNFSFAADVSMYPDNIADVTQPSPPYPDHTKGRLNPVFTGIVLFNRSANTSTEPQWPISARICPDNESNYLDARPFSKVPMPAANFSMNLTIDFKKNSKGVQLAYINDLTFDMDTIGTQYGIPELHAFVNQSKNGDAVAIGVNASGAGPVLHADSSLRYYIPDSAVVDIFLNNQDDGEHPFHLHGHTFPIIATSHCPQADFKIPLRRDTVTIPAGGWALIRLTANNPGAWMFHCHIDWHMEAGLGALFMEGPLHVRELNASSQLCPQMPKTHVYSSAFFYDLSLHFLLFACFLQLATLM